MKKIINLIIAYLVTFAVFNLGGFESSDILLGVVFVAVYVILGRLEGVTERAGGDKADSSTDVKRPAYIIAAVWTALYCIYAADRLGGGMENRLFAAVYSVCTVAGVYLLISQTLRYVLAQIAAHISDESKSGEEDTGASDPEAQISESGCERFSVRRFFIFAGIIFVCLFPFFLMNYPGTMTVDSFDQLNQARGIYPYSDLHPWAHTMLIKLFWSIGYAVTGSVNAGVASFIIFQMLIMSFAMAYVIESLAESGLNRMGCVAVLLGYLIYPYNIAYSITMWKDVVFSAGVIVFTVTLYRVLKARRWGARDITLFTVSGLMVCLMRHNGFYAFIVTAIVFVICFCNRLTVMLSAAVIIITCLINGPVHQAYGVESTEYAHNLAIPLQQVARVVSHNGDISAHDMEMLERINTPEFLRTHYEPGGADPSMQWVIFGDMAYLESHKAEYLGLWIRLGIRNPRAYVEAFIDQTRGYYTTMLPEQTEYYGILPNEDGLMNEPVIAATKRVKLNEIMSKIHTVIPVYAILYSPGACIQLMMLGVAVLILVRRKGRPVYALIAYVPVTALILTVIIATPLCADLRYAYPLVLCMPLLIAMTYQSVSQSQSVNSSP